MLLLPLSGRRFDLYALSLPRGPNFDPYRLHSAWRARDGVSVGAVLLDPDGGDFATRVLRRQVDHRFVLTHQRDGLAGEDTALTDVSTAMRLGEPPEPLRSGVKRRRAFADTRGKRVSDYFQLITSKASHFPALMTIGETYLALPRPDDNFVSDFQTENFSSRLWELYLFAAFREQGVAVTQGDPSPDFHIERNGHECFVEAVTAQPKDGRPVQGFPKPTFAPTDRKERMLGAPATRFAKTLGNKLVKNYHQRLAHIRGKPFAFAVADFHAAGAVVWSREALPCYLYGVDIHVSDGPDGRRAQEIPIERLLDGFPAGLFRDPAFAHLSAVVFSNAGTLSKFNRMGYLAGWRPPGVKMIRDGHLFDRTPGALESIPFCLDILSEEYAALWPGGEAWCQELEVFHNPCAAHPISFDLLPGATHWFEQDGEIQCSSIWQWSVLASVTQIVIEK